MRVLRNHAACPFSFYLKAVLMITNEHWYLDAFQSSDKKRLTQCLQDRDIVQNTLNIPFPYTEKDAEEWILLKDAETAKNGQPVSFVIRNADGELIGAVGFNGLKIGQSHAGEIGYWLAKSYRGRGIATQAVQATCKIAFQNFGLVRIEGRVFESNLSSSRVLEKSGFNLEGLMRKSEKKDDKFIDVKLYALINE